MLHYSAFRLNPAIDWVVFVHGAGGSSSIWHKQIRAFRQQFNVLLLDLRGHGKSKLPAYEQFKRYQFDQIGNDIIEVLDHLKINKSHFVGISLGTIVIRELLERFPERANSMVLAGAVMKINLKGQLLMFGGNLFKSVLPYMVLYKLFAFVILPKKNHKESRNLFIQEAQKLYQKEFKRWFGLVADVNPMLKFFRQKDIGIPTLYVMGSEDHMFLPAVKNIIEQHQSASLQVLDDCGHVVNVEQPNRFNLVVLQWLKQMGKSH